MSKLLDTSSLCTIVMCALEKLASASELFGSTSELLGSKSELLGSTSKLLRSIAMNVTCSSFCTRAYVKFKSSGTVVQNKPLTATKVFKYNFVMIM